MHVEVVTPLGDLVGAVGQAIDNGHSCFLSPRTIAPMRRAGQMGAALLTERFGVRQVGASHPIHPGIP
jgi:hypothetical protein